MFFLSPISARAKKISQEICPGKVIVEGSQKIDFNELEKAFLCGDPKIHAWSHIPMAQAKYHLETFLQQRGYFHVQFEERDDVLVAQLGEPTLVSNLVVNGAPDFLDMSKRRHINGRRLTPGFLDQIENWIKGRLKNNGYPCPTVKSRADINSGLVIVDVDPGSYQNVISIAEESIPGTKKGVLRRFDAFKIGKPYEDDLLNLTSTRIEKNGLLQDSYFTVQCQDEGAALTQHVFAGKPRLLKLSFGFDTEQYGIFKMSWKHTRLGDQASVFDLSLFASYKTQEIDISNAFYWFKPESRWHFLPSLTFIHDRQSEYHLISGNARLAAATTWDNQDFGLEFSVGPNLNYVDTFRGATPGLTRFVSLQYDLELMSHDFELYPSSPRSGFDVQLKGDFNNRYLLSEITAQRFSLEWHYLYNILSLDPPLFVLGVRGGFYGTLVGNNPVTRAKLPPNYRFYLGGSENLRGFALQELPNQNGALSAAFLSFEARLADLIPFKIQPFVFIDVGILGPSAFRFQLPVYLSPGFGLRYESPIGVFRASFARGFKAGGNDFNPDNTHFQFFISFGEEF